MTRAVNWNIPCSKCGELHHASGGGLCMPCYIARQEATAKRFRGYAAEPGLAYGKDVLLGEARRLEEAAGRAALEKEGECG